MILRLPHGRWMFWWCAAAACLAPFRSQGMDLDKLTDARLMESPANDGDSFIVRAGDRQLHLRLYFVDCPETVVTNDVDAKRVREQAGYFGLTNVVTLVEFGRQAKAFTAQQLSKPFTVYTAYADAMGRSPTKRIYAFIVTAEGKDLASELVENGLARVHGTLHETPDGVSAQEMQQRLRDLEIRATLKRAGAWKEADPDEIARQRAAQREEERQLEDVRRQVGKNRKPSALVNINTGSSREIQSLSGVGPSLAARIIANRPYRSVDDLLRVEGIGTNLLEKIRARVVVAPPTPPAHDSPSE